MDTETPSQKPTKQQTQDALELCILKYQRAVDGQPVRLGMSGCDLCDLFLRGDDARSSCEGCPINTRTGNNSCQGTPYTAIAKLTDGDGQRYHGNGVYSFESAEAKAAAQAELDFLISLREPVIPTKEEIAAALDKLIAKYQRAIDGEPVALGTFANPLCMLFKATVSGACAPCPVMQRTGEPWCDGTPSKEISKLVDEEVVKAVPSQDRTHAYYYLFDTDEAKAAALRELDFLISLREPGTVNEQTAAALEASIAKWVHNATALAETELKLGPGNCPLCTLFNRHDVEADNCKDCPVMWKTGRQYCYETPYYGVAFRWAHASVAIPDAVRKTIVEELEFLKSLRGMERPS